MGQALRRGAALILAFAQVVTVAAIVQIAGIAPADAATFSCMAGNDGSPGTLSGVYDSYYKPGLGTISAGATSIGVGTIDTSSGGASTSIAIGDELLVMQMQDGTFTYTNSASYGSGASIGNAGLYEYVQVKTLVGSTAGIVGAGSGNGLINSYTESAATGSHGQQTYQIIRVPQYLTATLSSTFRAAYWNGKTGGVAALDVASTLNLGGATIYATGNGFRGGGLAQATVGAASALNSDYVASATMNGANPSTNPPADGFKGEGIFGTPDYTFGYTVFTTPSTPTTPVITKATSGNGYPGGDVAMGAPGNAGGGGTDMNPSTNDSNSGGGGGGNAGTGGIGGYPWSTQYTSAAHKYYSQDVPGLNVAASYGAVDATHNPDIGGRGASAIAIAGRALMGGGGGAGSNNNGSGPTYGSSGGVGGGVVLLRIADTSGSAATIHADGTVGIAPDNDGGGGGGAGGTVIVTSPNAFSGFTITASGADGTLTAQSNKLAHGPGGGGGGGIVYSSSSVSASVPGGANGTTYNGKTGNTADSYGSTSGSSGTTNLAYSYASVPGVPSGSECFSTGGTTIFIGPVDNTEVTYKGANYTGSYDGSLAATNNNDFTARSFVTGTSTIINSGTVPGTPIGNVLTGTSSVSVPDQAYYHNSSGSTQTVTINSTAPVAPSGWTVQTCNDNGVGTAGTGTGGNGPNLGSCSAAGATSSAGQSVPNGFNGTLTVWSVYAVPTGTTAFTRYDAVERIDDGTTSNYTHHELYAGFVPITKTTTVVASGCPAGVTPPSGGLCPGGVLQYALDFRDVMVGAGLGTEGQLLSAFLATAAGQLAIADNGGSGSNNWATSTNGLKIALSAGGVYTTCGTGVNACGSSVTGTTFTGGTAASTAFTATIGGAAFQLKPSGITGGTSSGTVIFALTIK